MAEKTLNARLKLKYDTLANWNSSSAVPLSGEACVAVIDANNATGFDASKAPIVGIKIGDEVTVSFEPSATERDGRWFGSNKAYRVVRK